MIAVLNNTTFLKAYQGRVLVSAELLLHPEFFTFMNKRKKDTTQWSTK